MLMVWVSVFFFWGGGGGGMSLMIMGTCLLSPSSPSQDRGIGLIR